MVTIAIKIIIKAIRLHIVKYLNGYAVAVFSFCAAVKTELC